MTKPSASSIAGCITSCRPIVPLSWSASAIASTIAGTVPPLGPLPGMTPASANLSGVASPGATPWPLISDTFFALPS